MISLCNYDVKCKIEVNSKITCMFMCGNYKLNKK